MIKYTANLQLWKKANSHTNVPSILSKLYNITNITTNNDTGEVHLYAETRTDDRPRRDFGLVMGMLPLLESMTMDRCLQVILNVYKSGNSTECVMALNKFAKDDEATLIEFPITSAIVDHLPKYLSEFYDGMYDFKYSTSSPFANASVIIDIGDTYSDILQDVTFLKLQDADINKIYIHKIQNMIPLDGHADTDVTTNEGTE